MAFKSLACGLLLQMWGNHLSGRGAIMTLKNTLLLYFIGIILFSFSTEAQIVPGPRPPSNPGYSNEQKLIRLDRQVTNQRLDLLRMAGIDYRYNGYIVDSITVVTRGSSYRAELALLANGRLEESSYSPQAQTTLRTRYAREIGREISYLELEVRQSVYIESIGINLRRGAYTNPGRELELPIYVNRRLYGNSSLDLTQYIDSQRYYGYRIQSISIQANAVYNSSLIDVLLNSFSQGQTLQVGRYSQVVTAYLQNAVIGQSASNIMLSTRGDIDIQKVTLRLLPR